MGRLGHGSKGDFYGAAIAQLIRDTDEELQRMDAAVANRQQRRRIDSELTTNLSKLTTTAAMEDPRFLEMMQVVERHTASVAGKEHEAQQQQQQQQLQQQQQHSQGSVERPATIMMGSRGGARSTPKSREERQREAKETYLVTQLSKMLRECLTPTSPGEFKKLTKTVHEWYRSKDLALPPSSRRGAQGTGASQVAFPAAESRVFPVTGQHPAPSGRRVIHFADDNRKEENVLPPPRQAIPDQVVNPISGRSGAAGGPSAETRGGGFGVGSRKGRPDSAGAHAVRGRVDPYKPYDMHGSTDIDTEMDTARGQRRDRWEAEGGGDGGEEGAGFEHELFVQMREHMEEVEVKSHDPNTPRKERDPLSLRPQKHSSLDHYASRSLARTHEMRQLLAEAKIKSSEPTEEAKLSKKVVDAADVVGVDRPPSPRIEEHVRHAIRVRQRELKEKEARKPNIGGDPTAMSPRKRTDPSKKPVVGPGGIPESVPRQRQQQGGGDGADASPADGDASATAGGEESGSKGAIDGEGGDSNDNVDGNNNKSNNSEGEDQDDGMQSTARVGKDLFPEKPGRTKPAPTRRVYAGKEVLDVMAKRWSDKRHHEASERAEAAEVRDVVRMWQMHRGRIEEEISRRQENFRYSYADRPIASRAETPFGVEAGSFNLAVGSEQGDNPFEVNRMQGVEPGEGESALADLVDDDDSDSDSDDESNPVDKDELAESVHRRLKEVNAYGDEAIDRGGQVRVTPGALVRGGPADFIVLSPYHVGNARRTASTAASRRPRTATPLQIVRDSTRLRRQDPNEPPLKMIPRPATAGSLTSKGKGKGKGKGKSRPGTSIKPRSAPGTPGKGKGKKGGKGKKKAKGPDPLELIANLPPTPTRPPSAYRKSQLHDLDSITGRFSSRAVALPSIDSLHRALLIPDDRPLTECLGSLPGPSSGLIDDPLKAKKGKKGKKKKGGKKKGGKKKKKKN